MRPTNCQSSVSFFLNLLNYLQFFVGVLILLYSLWMLTDWNRHKLDGSPAPWFVYTVMSVGILLCLIALTGIVAAGLINASCLYFYAICVSILILLEAALLTDLVFNKHWEKELPHDATGDLEDLREFVEDNLNIFRWVVIIVAGFQAISLLLATILRHTVYTAKVDDDDEDFNALANPLLNPHNGLNSASTSVDSTVIHHDAWSSRMRQKYGLGPSHPPNNRAVDILSDGRRKCSIL